ncbi:hypothetical protein SS1G_10326 [Sclerotinia sclerotiorum 1980 UF-70]|uniref:Uncharacterized protein n=1 Tax=Sclerotinia sclerotiorum (strain ATCC 18683 / 1980 / Ss-1) TaxID=665079 RepID=A7EYB1_SCLS1|nr:hypothetical protein SS1G_10326 [Sclerotinia sclerotiorum 1980 UF-70]EDN94453.1 hypothetical protein SS1G_10326 [Sclerotinia sclerotiorum 1980 UF-70]
MSLKSVHLLAGKTAAITGGTTGIGRAITLLYLRQGCNVAVNHLGLDSDIPHLESLHKEAKSLLEEDSLAGSLLDVPGDVSKPETGKELVEKAVRKWGRLDIFVIRTNLDGAFYTSQAAARQMSTQSPPGGAIVAISSISALVGGAQQTHYTPTKAGVLSLMQSMACALGKYGIRCNALLPGTIRTQLNEEDLKDEQKRKYMEGRIPLGRTGVPGDLAGPAVFLACEELSGYVNGSGLLVDGGLFVNLQ